MSRTRTLALAVVGGALALGGTAPAHAEDVPGAPGYLITGHGYGHGHGMSQYGALGAARQGRTWQQIVGFYYPGTKIKRGGGTIKVLLTEATKKTVQVDAQKGLRLRKVGSRTSWKVDRARPKATRWRIQPKAQKTVVTYKVASGWKRFVVIKGEAELSAGKFPVTLRLPDHEKARYRGALRSVDGQTVNVLSLDQYVRGVVPREVFTSWPEQALRAQAVAARTYAAFERAQATGSYDICDNESCQVYGGYDAEVASTDQAVKKTRAKILTYQGQPAFTQFSSSNGGWSATGSQPYLVAQADPFEAASDNPSATWGPITFSEAELEQAWPQVGTISDLALTREGNGEWGGWVTSVTITGTKGSVTMTGDAFRQALNLRSAYLQVVPATQKQLLDSMVARLVPWGKRA